MEDVDAGDGEKERAVGVGVRGEFFRRSVERLEDDEGDPEQGRNHEKDREEGIAPVSYQAPLAQPYDAAADEKDHCHRDRPGPPGQNRRQPVPAVLNRQIIVRSYREVC